MRSKNQFLPLLIWKAHGAPRLKYKRFAPVFSNDCSDGLGVGNSMPFRGGVLNHWLDVFSESRFEETPP